MPIDTIISGHEMAVWTQRERVALSVGMRPMVRGKCHHDDDVANFNVYGWLNAFK